MGLLLNLKDNVARLDTRGLVTLAAELDLGAALHTTIDVNVKNLPVDDGLLAGTVLATVLGVDHLSLSVTVGTNGLEALNHGAHLAHHGLHTMTVAASAPPDCALLAAATVALRADDGPLKGELGDFAAVDVLERHLVRVVNGAGLGRSSILHAAAEHAAEATASTEELREQVLGGHATSPCAAL